MSDLLTEAHQVIRGLFRSHGFTLLAVVTMAVGIGVNTVMFSVIEKVILRPLPYRDSARIVMLWSGVPKKDIQKNWTSYPDIQDWRRESHSFWQIAAILRIDTANLSGGEQVERIKVGRVSSEFFSVLGVAPRLGRSWTEVEEERRTPVAVLSYEFWQTHFGGARDVNGKPLEIDHTRAIVVGVMPADFDFPTADTRGWIPLTFISQWPAFLTARQADAFNAPLQAGVTPQQAQQEMASICVRPIPGIQGTGAIDALFNDYVPDDIIDVEGHAHVSPVDDSETSGSHVVSVGFFETAAVPLLRGRFFASTDGPDTQPVAIINRTTAHRLWPGENPIGGRFRYGVPGETPSMWRTVVGVVGDTLPDGPESRAYAQFFLPQTQVPWTASMHMVIRVADNRLPLASSIRAVILSVSSEIPRFEVTIVESELKALGNRRRFQTWLLSSFSAMALVLAAIGIYGLISYSVTERTAEIGVRMALGARPVDIMGMILGQLSILAGAGLLLGLAGALALSHAASNLLFGVAWTDGLTLAMATLLLFMVALTAGFIPAKRATKVDPVIALSCE